MLSGSPDNLAKLLRLTELNFQHLFNMDTVDHCLLAHGYIILISVESQGDEIEDRVAKKKKSEVLDCFSEVLEIPIEFFF